MTKLFLTRENRHPWVVIFVLYASISPIKILNFHPQFACHLPLDSPNYFSKVRTTTFNARPNGSQRTSQRENGVISAFWKGPVLT